ncbi:MAG: UDP-N-acetylmuramoyl-L-alanyl-D-glutamate--2,6-diaminopimelate ligase [Phycisphaerales bacterium]|nr:UDP-N-acetylmuramoyl-L-alanyl-D-glutamate--2,6-diaminopimelate ligase [Phycisphaerales bacterium]
MTTTNVSQRTNQECSPTRLRELLRRSLDLEFGSDPKSDFDITDICCDSRQVKPGALFVAVTGTSVDGASFASDAARRGAVAIVADRELGQPLTIPVVKVPNARDAVSRLAAVFFGLDVIQAKGELTVIGITGTNGKSTTAYMLREILRFAGRPTAMLGTIEYDLLAEKLTAQLTTPDPVTLVRHLVQAHEAGARFAVMEVSSHSLDQRRVAGIKFSTAIFTNLTQDHLDYHGTFEDYSRAKRRLFDGLSSRAVAVVNADEAATDSILKNCAARVIRYGMAPLSDVRAHLVSETKAGSRFILNYEDRRTEMETALVGRHNISNALAAVAAALELGLGLDTIRQGLAELSDVPGRLQRVDTGGLGFDVFVDYAHTDDALRNVLRALRPLTSGKLLCVFGCGGDRDRTKRPLMARAVADGADAFVMTSDNPRTEDPMAIITDIENGLTSESRQRGVTEVDRRKAITRAIERVAPGDTLLIAGKGHEDYQILGNEKVHFDDVEIASGVIEKMRGIRKES